MRIFLKGNSLVTSRRCGAAFGFVLAVALAPASLRAELVTEREFTHKLSDVPGDGLVEVDNVAGSVKLHGTDNNEVVVKGQLGRNVEGVEIDQSRGTVSVQVVLPERSHSSGDAELEIWLPRHSEISVTTVSADIEAEGVRGEQRLKAVSGSVATESGEGRVSVAAVSGDVDVRGHGEGGETDIESVSGDVRGEGLNGDVSAASVSGDVQIDGGILVRGNFTTTSGDIDIVAAMEPHSRIELESISGDVEFEVQGEKYGSYDINTFSGDIDNCFGPKPEKKRGKHQRQRFEITDDKARIRASTLSGDISICD